jgi:hypothetical protein
MQTLPPYPICTPAEYRFSLLLGKVKLNVSHSTPLEAQGGEEL